MLQAETAALAPWKQAIALARQARCPGSAVPATPPGTLTAAQARPLAPERAADAAAEASQASPASPAVPSAAQAEPCAPIRPASTRAASPQVLGSTDAQGVVRPLAPERAAGGAGSTPAPARLAAQPRADAPERVAGAAATGPTVARATPAPARAEPLAPIPPAPVRGALDQALASARAEPAAKPQATERPRRGATTAPAPACAAAQPKAHAPPAGHAMSPSGAAAPIARQGRKPHVPVTAAATHRTDDAAIRRAAAQWRAKQRMLRRS